MDVVSAAISFVSLLFARTGPPAPGADPASLFARVSRSVASVACRAADGEVDFGSGFVLRSNRRMTEVVTAAHVVACGGIVRIRFQGRPPFPARVLVLDRRRDVALVQTVASGRPALVLADASRTRPGQAVAIVGYPRISVDFANLGDTLQPTIHMGVVCAMRLDGSLLQFDATSDSGDSGGPVVDPVSGSVLGIVQGAMTDAQGEDLPGGRVAVSARAIEDAIRPGRHPADALLARYLAWQPAGSADQWSPLYTDPAIFLGLVVVSVVGLLWLGAAWRIVRRVGYPGAWALLTLVPVINVLLPYVFAFAEWPVERRTSLWDALSWDDLECDEPQPGRRESSPGPLRAWLGGLERYGVFAGRTGRREFWYFHLVNVFGPLTFLGVSFFVVMLTTIAAGAPMPSLSWMRSLCELYAAVTLLPALAICVRRLHDTGRSGWNLWLAAVPLVGLVVVIAMLAEPSQRGPNRWGQQPPAD